MLNALLFAKTSPLLAAIYPGCIWKINTQQKVIYLTFDDGPIAEVTPFILDELNRWNAKATFFCIGKNILDNPAIFNRIVAEKHAIGNHTLIHLNGWNYSNPLYFENIQQCETILNNKLEPSRIKLFRPPYGKLKPAQYAQIKKHYKIIMWDVLSFDFDLTISKEKVLHNVLKNTEPGSIVVFHDSLKAKDKIEFALPQVLQHFTQKGFTFQSISNV